MAIYLHRVSRVCVLQIPKGVLFAAMCISMHTHDLGWEADRTGMGMVMLEVVHRSSLRTTCPLLPAFCCPASGAVTRSSWLYSCRLLQIREDQRKPELRRSAIWAVGKTEVWRGQKEVRLLLGRAPVFLGEGESSALLWWLCSSRTFLKIRTSWFLGTSGPQELTGLVS